MSAIGDRLRAERERLRLSQAQFGELGGVKRNAQSHYEAGDRAPDAEYLAGLAEAGLDVFFVLTGVPGAPPNGAARLQDQVASFMNDDMPVVGELAPAEARIIWAYRRASPDDKRVIDRVMQLTWGAGI